MCLYSDTASSHTKNPQPRISESRSMGNSLRTWEFHPLRIENLAGVEAPKFQMPSLWIGCIAIGTHFEIWMYFLGIFRDPLLGTLYL